MELSAIARGKQAMRKGTFFDNSKLSIQQILWIVWHFVYHLSEQQCKHYTNIGAKNNNTVVKWYGECRLISSAWIWKHGISMAHWTQTFPGQNSGCTKKNGTIL